VHQIGPYSLRNNLFLAPMVGVCDAPFREICSQQGAGITVAEMLPSSKELWEKERHRLRRIRAEVGSPQVIQIAGSDPAIMAMAARRNAEMGADAIDINMGCPAKKVMKKAAGSALLKDTALVEDILRAIVAAVDVPVTLKIRTGWCPASRNGVDVAKIAEDCGIQLLTVHGRTRECRFKGAVEYDTIAAIKQAVSIPIVANGDIDSPERARQVLSHTGADAVMIGRGAQGSPWIFAQIEHYLSTGTLLADPGVDVRHGVATSHLAKLHAFYGDKRGALYARKHVSGYVDGLLGAREFMQCFNAATEGQQQLDLVDAFFETAQPAQATAEGLAA
jgi:tRNA-dihydrouridine synthase B